MWIIFCIFFGYLERYESRIEEERNILLANLFRIIKNSLLNLNIKRSFISSIKFDELINLKYKYGGMNYAEMEVDLILYCILVNGPDKTKGEKFNKIKNEMQPLTKILKKIFCKFDKNKIHKKRTFIFALRSPTGYDDDYYIINYKDDMLRCCSDDDDISSCSSSSDDDDVKSMFLHKSTNKDEKDKRKFKYGVVLDHSLYGGKKEYKL